MGCLNALIKMSKVWPCQIDQFYMRKVPIPQEEEGKLVGCGGETEGTRALALPHMWTLGGGTWPMPNQRLLHQ